MLRIEYVPLSTLMLWDKNPKKHDIGALAESIERYGFRDAPIYDETLGALVAGNGRAETLAALKSQGSQPPTGIATGPDGAWLVPVQVGVDARSASEAEAFAIDHNNVTLMGGDLGLYDLAKLWDESYTDLLQELAARESLPLSVPGDDLDALLRALGYTTLPDLHEGDHENALVVTIKIGDPDALEPAAASLRGLVESHPEWRAQIVGS